MLSSAHPFSGVELAQWLHKSKWQITGIVWSMQKQVEVAVRNARLALRKAVVELERLHQILLGNKSTCIYTFCVYIIYVYIYIYYISHSEGEEMKVWYHVRCMFETLQRARATTKKIETPDDLEEFAKLKNDDKDEIKQLIKGVI